MAIVPTTYGDISQRTANWAASQMLKHAEPVLVLGKFGQMKPIPKNKAQSAKFRRPNPFSVATTPLTEGVTPSSHKITYTDVPVTLQQYGDIVSITDWIEDLSEDPVLSDVVMLSGEQAAETHETLLWGVLKAGTNKRYANGAARNAVNTVYSLTLQRGAVRSLRANRASPVTQILNPSSNTLTSPIEAAWVAFAHTDLEHDLRNVTGFTPVAQYGSRQVLCPEEIGTIENVRYILSPVLTPYPDAGGAKGAMKSTTGTNADVYPVVIISRDYYAQCPLAGKGMVKPMVLNPGTPSKSDPLGQRGYVSWKSWWAGVILNEAWGVVCECAVTSL